MYIHIQFVTASKGNILENKYSNEYIPFNPLHTQINCQVFWQTNKNKHEVDIEVQSLRIKIPLSSIKSLHFTDFPGFKMCIKYFLKKNRK